MKKQKELRKEDQCERAHAKYPTILRVKQPGEAVYTPYSEY